MKKFTGSKAWLMVTVLVVAVFSIALVACESATEDTGGASPAIASGGLSVAQLGSTGSSQSSGLHVTGVGTVTASPDLALVSLGVKTSAKTVSEAREAAAQAVTAMIASLRALGLQENTDIQTAHFNIQPEYVWEEEIGTTRRAVQRLVGYQVTNTLTAKVRDLDNVGAVIDGAAAAGGDATRVNSVRFTVEDSTALQEQARLLALQEVMRKADVFASELGVGRGKLQYVAELSASQPVRAEAVMESRIASAAAPTPILAGELEVTVQVRAIFAIQ